MIPTALIKTNIPGKKLFSRGKVRDTYLIPGWHRTNGREILLMITTDRLSAFDAVVAAVPDAGKLRNLISFFWFGFLESICPNHVISADQQLCAATVKEGHRQTNDLLGRSLLVHKAWPIMVECVVRGFLAGSAWESYRKNGKVCGIKLPSGLKEAEELSEPIFTPTTKANAGHDEPIDFDALVKMVGGNVAEELRRLSLKIYKTAVPVAKLGGIIIADTKFEFGIIDGKLCLIDEALTPDSSRFWDLARYSPGRSQPSFDKQPVRDWLEKSGWDKKSPPPKLSGQVIAETQERYIACYQKIVGKRYPPEY